MEQKNRSCLSCKNHYIDRHNNYRCEKTGKIIRPTWGRWLVDANKCKDYK